MRPGTLADIASKAGIIVRGARNRIVTVVAAAFTVMGLAAAPMSQAAVPGSPPLATASAPSPLWVAVETNSERRNRYFANGIAVDPATGGVRVVGLVDEPTSSDQALRTVAYGPGGTRFGAAEYDAFGGSSDNQPADVAIDPRSGNVYVTIASALPDSAGNADYLTLAYSRGGSLLWQARYDGPSSTDDGPVAVAVDPTSGTVYVTGFSGLNRPDYATIAYSPTGRQLWVARYDGPAGGLADRAQALTVDAATGTVYVTGDSVGGNGDRDLATVAYSRTGAQLWVTRLSNAQRSLQAADIVVDSGTGTVYVAGSTDSVPAPPYFRDVVFAGYDSDGALIFNRTYGGGRYDDIAVALATDPSTGNGVLVFETQDATVLADYATVSFSANGTQQWFARYNGPPGVDTDDRPRDVAVDPRTGTVYVTGSSTSYFDDPTHYATVAYSATGQRLGATVYDVPDGGSGIPVQLAIDPARDHVYITGTAYTQQKREWLTVAYPTFDD